MIKISGQTQREGREDKLTSQENNIKSKEKMWNKMVLKHNLWWKQIKLFFRYMCQIGHNMKYISYCESFPRMFEKHGTILSLFQIKLNAVERQERSFQNVTSLLNLNLYLCKLWKSALEECLWELSELIPMKCTTQC